MKKARITLIIILMLAAVGGTFAFRAMRNLQPTQYVTDRIITQGNIYYCSTFFCFPTIPFITTLLNAPTVQTWYTVTTNVMIPTTHVCTATNGNTITLTVRPNVVCTFNNTRVTMIN